MDPAPNTTPARVTRSTRTTGITHRGADEGADKKHLTSRNPVTGLKRHLRAGTSNAGIDAFVICAALFTFGALIAGPLMNNLSAMQAKVDHQEMMKKSNDS